MRSNQGYILLETLMAILILSVGVVMLSRALLLPARASATCRHTTKAYRLIDQKFDECRLSASPLRSSQGEVINDGQQYSWRVTTSPEQDNLMSVTIDVSWEDSGVKKSVKMSALVYDIAVWAEGARDASN